MRSSICLTVAVALSAWSVQAVAHPAQGNKSAAFQLNETTWTYTHKGTKTRESVDANGNYIGNSVAGKHLDHGTAVMKGDKACFTSAMTKEGEVCWTTAPVKIGHSFVTTSDKGEKLKVTRIKYVPMSMPK